MTAETQSQEFTFQAEIQSLLQILSHSLYQNREIALRELISNASDALDKLRHAQLTSGEAGQEGDLLISLEPDEEARTLTIRDNGIGMSREELVENLGTIAHSGSLAFLKQLAEQEGKAPPSLIGQFGVGFYSAFMLADRVEVITRRHAGEDAWRWESEGTGSFRIEPTSDIETGTAVVLHLKAGDEYERFTQKHALGEIVRKYSTFVPHPIQLDGEQTNKQKPIWVEPTSQVSVEQHNEFYQHVSRRPGEEPIWRLHFAVDSPLQFHAVLYCPPTNYELLGFGKNDHGIHLCAKRILVQSDCRDLLPEYLRFLFGLVDSADLPLNVSRETLQDDAVFRKISRILVKRVLKNLEKLAKDDETTFEGFIRQYGSILREGVNSDFEHREQVAGLLRFASTKTEGESLTGLAEYLERAGEGCEKIYFLGGPEPDTLRKSPHLEPFRQQEIEVLLLDDPVDEFVLSQLGEFQGKQLVPADSADIELGEEDADADDPPDGFSALVTIFKDTLGDKVEDVRQAKRLGDSPCRLVNPGGGMSTQMQKLLQHANKDFTPPKQILELNARNKLVARLSALTVNSQHADFVKSSARHLFELAQLREGIAADLAGFAERSECFLGELAEGKSPIIS